VKLIVSDTDKLSWRTPARSNTQYCAASSRGIREIQKPLKGVDDWAHLSNRVCRFLPAEGGVFPTDAKLLNRARKRLVRLAKKLGVSLRQSHARQDGSDQHQRYPMLQARQPELMQAQDLSRPCHRRVIGNEDFVGSIRTATVPGPARAGAGVPPARPQPVIGHLKEHHRTGRITLPGQRRDHQRGARRRRLQLSPPPRMVEAFRCSESC
jgi:hypothetical protein